MAGGEVRGTRGQGVRHRPKGGPAARSIQRLARHDQALQLVGVDGHFRQGARHCTRLYAALELGGRPGERGLRHPDGGQL